MFRAPVALLCLCALSAYAQTPALAIIEKASGKAGFYDAQGKVIKEVPVGIHPHEMTFSSDGRYLFTSDNGVMLMTEKAPGENTVSMIDVAKMEKVATIDLGKYRRPHGIDFDSATGHVLVTTELPSALLIIDPAKRAVMDHYDVHGQAPHMVRMSPDHQTAWVTCTDTSNVSLVDLKTRAVKTIATGPRPQGIAFTPDGKRAFIANSDGEGLTVIDVAGAKVTGQITVGAKHSGPVRVVISPDGTTAISALQLQHAISFANTATIKEEKVIPLPGLPVSMTLSADGKQAYCSVLDQDTIFVISIADRKIVRSFKTPAHSGPDPVLPIPSRPAH